MVKKLPTAPIEYPELHMKLTFGSKLLNVLYLSHETPVPGWYYPPHAHSSYELHLIPEGRGTLVVSGRRYEIVPGTYYLTGPGVYHEQTADTTEPMREYCINFELIGSRRRKAAGKNAAYLPLEVEQLLQTLQNTTFWYGKDEYGSADLFNRALEEFRNEHLGYYTIVQNQLSQIIVNAIRSFSNERKSTYTTPKKILNDSRRHLVDNFFNEHAWSESPSVLADRLGMSVRQLERVLRAYYGMSYHQKRNEARMAHAQFLLRSGNDLIRTVAERCGFDSASYFTKVFGHTVGITPQEYRETAKWQD